MVTNSEQQITCPVCGLPNPAAIRAVVDVGGVAMTMTLRTCAGCNQKRLDAAAAAEQAKARLMESSRRDEWTKLCPDEYRTIEEGGKTDVAMLTALVKPTVRRKLQNWRGQRGLLLAGESYVGKTRTAWRLVRRCWDDGITIAAVTPGEFERQCRDAAGDFSLTEWFDGLANAGLLFMDDLGKGSWSQGTEANWFDLVEHRVRSNRPMLITTNEAADTLAVKMKRSDIAIPLVNRLKENCELISF